MAAGSQYAVQLTEEQGSSSSGVCTVEYQVSAPASAPSAMSRAAMVPTSNRSSGWRRRATATIPGDRSIPYASSPSPSRYVVTRPGPHPRSATGPPPPSLTFSAKTPSMARSNGLSASSVLSSSA